MNEITDREAWLRILAMSISEFPLDRGNDPEYIIGMVNRYYSEFKKIFPEKIGRFPEEIALTWNNFGVTTKK